MSESCILKRPVCYSSIFELIHVHTLTLTLTLTYIHSHTHTYRGFRGIIQKMSGKSGDVMRMTSGLSSSEADQKLLTKLMIYTLTDPKFYPK